MIFSKVLSVRLFITSDSLILCHGMKIKTTRRYSNIYGGNSKDTKCGTNYQSVGDFYAGKSVFVTGGTGFLGKVYLEKLLYSCNKLDKIYLLVREKKGVNVSKRLEELFANPIFNRLKASNPESMKKVVPINGDVTLPNLGLNQKDEENLLDKVSVVYHAAATVKFNDPLPVAMNINFEGTRKILELTKRMKNIEAFIYVSTAFAHTSRKVLLETVYPPPAEVNDVYKFIEEYGHDAQETRKFLDEQPTTYTFTKSLSEAYIAKNHGDVPTVIIRPSIVTSTKDEPLKGWLDNWYGGVALVQNAGRGWNRFALGSNDGPLDLIPVDYVSNMSVIAGARAKKSSDVHVYNCTSSAENPIRLGDVHKYFNREMVARGKNEIPYPHLIYVKSKPVMNIATFIFQTTPAQITDLWLKITGQKPKYMETLSKVIKVRDGYAYFTSNFWLMKAERARELYSSLSPEDKEEFPCDPAQIEWSEYIRNFCRGALKYVPPNKNDKSVS